MKVFGMISTRHSSVYTPHAVESFFRETALDPEDTFYLIDNDGSLDNSLLERFPRAHPVRNTEPKSFAANANQILAIALRENADLYFLNNDLIFTKSWLQPMLTAEPAILSPFSNREFQYLKDAFRCERTLELEEYLGKERELAVIVETHGMRYSGYMPVLSLPFFCVKIPYAVASVVGTMDESFGRGGAEDNDYCLRAYLKGFSVRYAMSSYVLHFNGKSTWSGAETTAETEERCTKFRSVFRQKWGSALLDLVIGQNDGVLRSDPELTQMASRGAYRGIVERLLIRGAQENALRA